MAPGLSSAEAARLLEQHGRNELQQEAPPSRLRVFAQQYESPLVALLAVWHLWTQDLQAGAMIAGCHVNSHYAGGMKATIEVKS